jgi:hypothetical protein
MRLFTTLAIVVALTGCGAGSSPTPSRPGPAPDALSVAVPVTPERVRRFPGPGTVELRTAGGRATWYALVVSQPPERVRDVCLAIGIRQQDPVEADRSCDVSTGRGVISFVEVLGIPDRYGPSPTVVSGVAAADVRSVRLEGPGGTRRLPLSAHRAFMAVYPATAHGKVRLVAQRDRGDTVRSFDLPLSRRAERAPQHRHRRPGAVFNDEIGEPILASNYTQIVRRFGPPVAVRTEHGLRCTYYEVVGSPHDGWQFCFAANGRMTSANGAQPPPSG